MHASGRVDINKPQTQPKEGAPTVGRGADVSMPVLLRLAESMEAAARGGECGRGRGGGVPAAAQEGGGGGGHAALRLGVGVGVVEPLVAVGRGGGGRGGEEAGRRATSCGGGCVEGGMRSIVGMSILNLNYY